MIRLSLIVLFLSLASVCWSRTFEITADPQQDLQSKIGPKECAKGSKYWCQDIRTAKQCGAVKHCIQVVWEHKKLPPDNNDVCEECKKMVEEARENLQSNTTIELIKEVLEGTCDIYFPIKIIAMECHKLVDEFIPEFIDILSSRMDPQTVCSVAWLCNSNKVRDLIKDVEILNGNKTTKTKTPVLIESYSTSSDACADCKVFAAEAIQKVKDMGQGEFENRMKAFCDKLSGALHTLCKLAAESKSSEIYTYITTEMKPDEVCALAAMCVDGLDKSINKQKSQPKKAATEKSSYVSIVLKNSGDTECDFCVQLVTRLKEIVVANSSREEIKDTLLSICGHLKLYKSECTDYVNNYFDEIYNFIIDEMNPNLVCQVLGLCGSKKPLIGQDESASYGKINVTILHPFSKPETSISQTADCKVENKVQCAMCEYAMHELQNMLMDNKSEEAIKNAVEKVCLILPKTIKDECDAFIDQYGPAICALLAQELDPTIICTEIGLCGNSNNNAITDETNDASKQQLPIDRMVPTNKQMAGKEECLYCQYSMELLHAVLSMNGTKDAIVLGLDDLCHELPSTWRNTCDSFVELYAESFLTVLQQQNLTELCSFLSVCSGSVGPSMYQHSVQAAKAAINHTNSESCSLCEVTVELISKLLNNPTISGDVVKAVEQVCLVVPKASRSKCEGMIEIYGPYFIKMVSAFTNPKEVCHAVRLCDPPLGQVNLLGGKKCTYGPSYWCQSKVHAKACKAEEHCRRTVWKN